MTLQYQKSPAQELWEASVREGLIQPTDKEWAKQSDWTKQQYNRMAYGHDAIDTTREEQDYDR